MTIVEWTPDLNTGIPDIDEQHKQMLHHINDFYEAANAKDKDRMSIVLFDLINSTLAPCWNPIAACTKTSLTN